MKSRKYAILALAVATGIFAISFSVPRNEAQKTSPRPSANTPPTRTYYIAAEKTTWNYAPSGKDQMTGKPVPAPWGDQLVYEKVRYFEYTDDSFTKKKPQPAWLGILGPIIRGVEGDTIKVVFYNKANKSYSVHPHGLHYDKDNEGATHEAGGEDHDMSAYGQRLYAHGRGRGQSCSRTQIYLHLDRTQ